MILITGSNGFLGRNLIDELFARKYRIRAFVGPGNMEHNLDGKVAEVLHGDILSPASLQQAVEGCEAIIHAAANTSIWPPRSYIQRRINIDGTANVVEAAKSAGVGKLVYVGSATSFGYGSKEDPGDETRPYLGRRLGLDYFDSKYEAQKIVLKAAESGDVPAVVVNPTYMFGAYDAKPGSGTLILGTYHQKLPGGGTGGRNYASVKDVAVGIANALEKGKVGKCYILGNENLSYSELFAKISSVIGKPASKTTWPAWLGRTVGLAGSIYGRVFNVMPALTLKLVNLALSEHYYTARRAVQELEMPQTPIETAIDEAFQWFRDNGYLDLQFLRQRVQRRGST
ncbi:MAG: NAD-dependent epimerase/dehydratase family protein [Spirochaetaceae bacterium]|nr:MAG: NAD-dependent epimerase/dehydratase family protein [Spirochaetaceae bacterium]